MRRANVRDRRAILRIDDISRKNAQRQKWIVTAIQERAIFEAVEAGQVLGFAILRRSFFGRFFIELIYVRADRRRSGIGGKLLRYLEARASKSAGELWTSSNHSNKPMRRLLTVNGYSVAGRVTGLDAGDPEIFYVKKKLTAL